MQSQLDWDEPKRIANLAKHGLDFKNAAANASSVFGQQARQKRSFIMNGSAAAARNEREAILQAMKTPPVDGYFAWDGLNEDERPASAEEMQAGVALALKKRGRPSGSGVKEQVAIRFDRDVVQAFRATGKGWQTRMNDALKDWLRTHTPLT